MATFHTLVLGVALQAAHLLPAPVRRALDAWSGRVARQRALRRQRAFPPKG